MQNTLKLAGESCRVKVPVGLLLIGSLMVKHSEYLLFTESQLGYIFTFRSKGKSNITIINIISNWNRLIIYITSQNTCTVRAIMYSKLINCTMLGLHNLDNVTF